MIASDIFDFELSQFKNTIGAGIDFTTISKINIKSALNRALVDTLAMATKRFKTSYKDITSDLLDFFVDDYFNFATIRNDDLTGYSFNILFDTLAMKFIDKMKKLDRPMFANFGFAQKFVSMSFKYIYCFDKAERENFIYCKLPLDKYTINWFKKYGDKDLIKQFEKIGFCWSNINKELYNKIQDNIDCVLNDGCYYSVNCSDPSQIVILPTNKIEVEFIVWSQEKLNETFADLAKFENYFDRLGIIRKGIGEKVNG